MNESSSIRVNGIISQMIRRKLVSWVKGQNGERDKDWSGDGFGGLKGHVTM